MLSYMGNSDWELVTAIPTGTDGYLFVFKQPR